MIVMTLAYTNCAKSPSPNENSSIQPQNRSGSDAESWDSSSAPSTFGNPSTSGSNSNSSHSVDTSNFKSVHQLPNRTRANYNGAIVSMASQGFKNLLDPSLMVRGTDRATGKSMLEGGYYILDSTNPDIVSYLNDSQNYYLRNGHHPFLDIQNMKEFKVYFPKGAFFAGASGYLPQKTRFSVVLKMGQPPSRVAPLSQDEYRFDETKGSYQCGSIDNSANCPYVGFTNIGTISTNAYFSGATGEGFEKLLQGQEIIVGHQGGGSTALVPTLRRSANSPLEQGVWIYGRILDAEAIPQAPSYIYSVVADPYTNWLQGAVYQQDGDPK